MSKKYGTICIDTKSPALVTLFLLGHRECFKTGLGPKDSLFLRIKNDPSISHLRPCGDFENAFKHGDLVLCLNIDTGHVVALESNTPVYPMNTVISANMVLEHD